MMNVVDSFIGAFAPQTAMKRALARRHMELLKRNYDAASFSNRTKAWFAPKTSVQVETKISLATLRDQSRELIRNTPSIIWKVSCRNGGNSTTREKLLIVGFGIRSYIQLKDIQHLQFKIMKEF